MTATSGKLVGIDLGTTFSRHRHAGRPRPGRHAAQPRRRNAHAQRRPARRRQRRRRPGGARRGPGAARPRRHAHQAAHGPSHLRPARRRPRFPARNAVGHHPAQAGPGRRAAASARSARPSSPCRPISTTPAARRPRTPAASPASTCSTSSTSRPPPPWPIPSSTRTSRAQLEPDDRCPIEQQTVLVYDLGGGTFDVTLVRLSQRRFEIAGHRRRRPPGRQGLGRPHRRSRRRPVPEASTAPTRAAIRMSLAGLQRRRRARQADPQQAAAGEHHLHARRQGADRAADARRVREPDARPADAHAADRRSRCCGRPG